MKGGSSALDVMAHPVSDIIRSGIWIEEQSKDTNRQKGTKQTEEMKKGEHEDLEEHSDGLELKKKGRKVEFSGEGTGASRLPACPKRGSELYPLGRRATQSSSR
uniref:Gag-pol protein n=1 Tax=Solanum tuberosum TaxID=4113 RepID=M1E0C7_SOLTU